MWKSAVSTAALVAMLGVAPATFAQTQTDEVEKAPATQEQTTQDQGATQDQSATQEQTTQDQSTSQEQMKAQDESKPEDQMQSQDQTQPQPSEQATTDTEVKTDEQLQSAESEKPEGEQVAGQIVMQDNDTFLATDFMGTNVYSTKDETIGDVNDLIFTREGQVDGVVIGVGGFLGIGEKDVAIKVDRIKMMETDDGLKLVLEATKDELDDAPEFKTKTAQRVDQQVEQARQEQEQVPQNQPATDPANPPATEQPAQESTQ